MNFCPSLCLFLFRFIFQQFAPINESALNILASNHSDKSNALPPFSSLTPFHHDSVLTENDKLPWPIPYENVEKESKWKTVRPENISYKRDFNRTNQSIQLNGKHFEQGSETTSIASSVPTNYPLFSTPFPHNNHPYEFESIHQWPNIQSHDQPQTTDFSILPVDEVYAQPIDQLNETKTEVSHAKDSLAPVERINKE